MSDPCSIADCRRPVASWGWCATHYMRWRKYKDVDRTATPHRGDPLMRFLSKTLGNEAGCWVWQASKNPAGYGYYSQKGKKHIAHRWIYQNMVAPIPEGLTIDHLCRNRACVNPDHLEAVTLQENIRRARKAHCLHGHLFDEANTYVEPSGKRVCRECQKKTSLRYYYRKKNGQTLSRV